MAAGMNGPLEFDVWRSVKRSRVRSETVMGLEAEISRIRKAVKKVHSHMNSLLKQAADVNKVLGKYSSSQRFPTGLLAKVNQMMETCENVTKEAQECLGMLGSTRVVTNTRGLNPDELLAVQSLKENRRALRLFLLQSSSKIHIEENVLVKTIAYQLQSRLDVLSTDVERYCGELSVWDRKTTLPFKTELNEMLCELEEIVLDPRANKNQAWVVMAQRKKRIMKNVLTLIDAESGLSWKLDGLGARGGGVCVVCETDYELRLSLCGHMCCRDCWRVWLKKSESCPICRRAVSKRDLQDLLKYEERSNHQDRVDLKALSRKIYKSST